MSLTAEVQAVIAVDADAYFASSPSAAMSCGSPGNIRSRRLRESFGPRPRCGPATSVLVGDQDAVAGGVIESVRRIPAKRPAYNLLVSPGGTYLANGIVVHNKGCFLPETLIRKEDGSEVPISSVRPEDRLLAFTIGGEAVIATGQDRGDSRGGPVRGRQDAEHHGSRHGGAPLLCRQRHVQDLGSAEGRRSHLRL